MKASVLCMVMLMAIGSGAMASPEDAPVIMARMAQIQQKLTADIKTGAIGSDDATEIQDRLDQVMQIVNTTVNMSGKTRANMRNELAKIADLLTQKEGPPNSAPTPADSADASDTPPGQIPPPLQIAPRHVTTGPSPAQDAQGFKVEVQGLNTRLEDDVTAGKVSDDDADHIRSRIGHVRTMADTAVMSPFARNQLQGDINSISTDLSQFEAGASPSPTQ
jgi:hypothetical protein